MFKVLASIKKEVLLLLNDKVGLSLMFGLPIVLVFLMTIIQDSAYKIVNENSIDMLISNQDQGALGDELIALIRSSKSFDIEIDNNLNKEQTNIELLKRDKLISVFIPSTFSYEMEYKAQRVANRMLVDLGLSSDSTLLENKEINSIKFFHDPVLQDNYARSLLSLFYNFLGSLEQSLMVKKVYLSMGIENPQELEQTMAGNKLSIEISPAGSVGEMPNPNSTQHNIPAWTIFAMFFMVLSLGSNITKEKNSGSFLRLRTVPTHFSIIILSKMAVYIFAALFQVAIILSIGILIFPHIGLPALNIPSQLSAFALIVVLTSLAAVSYAVMIGSIAKTAEQNNGIGSISVMIFAALGGIWVPLFALPEYMHVISYFSPMHWCLKGFYILFLSDGGMSELSGVIISIITFIFGCQLITFIQLKKEKLI